MSYLYETNLSHLSSYILGHHLYGQLDLSFIWKELLVAEKGSYTVVMVFLLCFFSNLKGFALRM